MPDETAVSIIPAPVSVTTDTVEGIPVLQMQLAEWARLKLAETSKEYTELHNACTEAKAHKWKHSAILTASRKAIKRVEYYEKVVAALESGYMLFPPIDNIDVIAIRTENSYHNVEYERKSNWRPIYETEPENLPKGVGEYKNPAVSYHKLGMANVTKKSPDGSTYTEKVQNWKADLEMSNPEFPLVMARVSCIEATSAAMEQKFFDSIAIYPRRARKDPVILGRIWDPYGTRWLSFLISWRVRKEDI
jgi:hypothetical protein